ncbi:hypothetical protein CLU86_3911 [Acidovorax sp. 62]|nr:hypothetical protein CLU86_3911 [Acidovorax sp. 62]
MRACSIVLALFFLALSTCYAEPLTPAVKAEVRALLTRLESSCCKFNRNGTWYSGQDARDHLQRKLEQVQERAKVPTTEAFIEMAAFKNGMTGKHYLVQCPGDTPVASALWLATQLIAVRKH